MGTTNQLPIQNAVLIIDGKEIPISSLHTTVNLVNTKIPWWSKISWFLFKRNQYKFHKKFKVTMR